MNNRIGWRRPLQGCRLIPAARRTLSSCPMAPMPPRSARYPAGQSLRSFQPATRAARLLASIVWQRIPMPTLLFFSRAAHALGQDGWNICCEGWAGIRGTDWPVLLQMTRGMNRASSRAPAGANQKLRAQFWRLKKSSGIRCARLNRCTV